MCGYDTATYNMVFLARLLFWSLTVVTQYRSCGALLVDFPDGSAHKTGRADDTPTGIDGYHVERVSTANAGVIVTAGAKHRRISITNSTDFREEVQTMADTVAAINLANGLKADRKPEMIL